MSSFIQESLDAHNAYRKTHKVDSLKHNQDLSDIAQKYADQIAAADKFEHSTNTYNGERLGENIAMKWASGQSEFTGQQVTDQWYSEVAKYTWGGGDANSRVAGHFSQVVWKASKEFGIGKARTSDGKWLVVANYLPAGNYLGQFNDNVVKPDGEIKVPEKAAAGGGGAGGDPSMVPGSKKETRTQKIREGNTLKTIVTETVTLPSGEKRVSTKTTVETVSGDGGLPGDFAKMNMSKPAVAAAGPAQTPDQFRQDALSTHNSLRSKHGSVPLTLNDELNRTAQSWADHMASSGKFAHSTNKYNGQSLGENVASKWSSGGATYTGKEVTEQWYSEIAKYQYGGNNFVPGTGHFTQVVWAGSKEMGIGQATGADGRAYVCANYFPAGNMQGDFVSNVHKPT